MKKISVIGSTGSIGVQTLNIVRRHPDKYKVVALSAGSNEDLLLRQTEEFKPDYIGIAGKFFEKPTCKYFQGDNAAEILASLGEADIVVIAIVGIKALAPAMAAVVAGKRIALANKEALVCGGDIIMSSAKKSGAEIIPVDSEHSALFQCLKQGAAYEVRKLILTASGGAYYSKDKAFLENITPEQAVKHPTWNMGRKISVDSATMVNKGLEIIEASRLYGISEIDYVIHPESIIHSLVEYIDGSTFALMSYPNMELAIQYALTYPDREICENVKPFDFTKNLTFLPKNKYFNAPELAVECIKAGGTAPAIYNSANEAAVNLFLNNKIRFTDIVYIIEKELNERAAEQKYDIARLISLNDEIINKVNREHS